MSWRRKNALQADVVRAILPDGQEVVWAILGDYHPATMEEEVCTLLDIPVDIYRILFVDCPPPFKEEPLS